MSLAAAAAVSGCAADPVGRTGAVNRFAGKQAGERKLISGVPVRWCPPGSFRMGAPLGEPSRRGDEAQVNVTLSAGFWIGETSVTQGQWRQVRGHPPGEFSAGTGDNLPIYNVNHQEAEHFCEAMTTRLQEKKALPADWIIRLPTEAQWEYACRAGTTTATHFGASLSSRQANFRGDFPYNGAEDGPVLGKVSPVGSYPANPWGLFDMHGNVFDWCRDWYHARLPGGVDPDLSEAKDTATLNGDGSISRCRRGGCWSDQGWACRSGFRMKYEPGRRADHIGFRITAFQL